MVVDIMSFIILNLMKTTRNKTPKVKVVWKKKPKAKTRSWEVKNLDAWFSRYIRILYANKE